jgi:hypothetical protein
MKTHLTADEARAAIKDYQKKTGKSQNEVAKELGYTNATALSRFHSGGYESEPEMIKRIEQLLKISAKREAAPKKPPYQATSTSIQVASLIELCHARGEMGVAYGDPGVGKTMAVKQYTKENEDAIVITISPTNATITGVNDLIAEKLGIKEKIQRRITAGIVAKLKGTKRVIVIDEAQHLKAKVVNHLRSIVDATEDDDTGERIGMALIGNDEIFFELKVKQAAAYSQVADRITYWEHLVAKEVKKDDIQLIFSEASFADDALNLLHKISTTVSIRKAVQVFTNALLLFNIKDYAELSTAHLATVAKQMKIKIAV